ncbi:uncharacterized protein [Nicotiana sylvestris]|uniref:uncharacterized protein n=1 Tax=Nicotiana sylvestris TaxID=4096 RepID=UPI00388C99A7
MRDHIIGEDYELWDTITDGPLATMKKNVERVDVPKIIDDCNAEDLRKWEKNDKAKKWLESKNIATLKLDELIGNLIAYELRKQTMKMDTPKKEMSLALRITEGVDLEEDKMARITKGLQEVLNERKGFLKRCKLQQTKGSFGMNYKKWETKWKKERAERRNRKKEQVHPKKNKGSTKAMVVTWRESSDEDSEDEDGDEQSLMAIGEFDEESEVSVIHLRDKIKFLSKERLSELLLDFIDESEDLKKEYVSKECVILKAMCKTLELRASESDSNNAELKKQVLELDTTVLELRSENVNPKLGTFKNKTDHTQLILEENLGKKNDELYKRDEQIRVLNEDLSKVQVKENSQIWYMDSGCSKHKTRNKNQFLSLEDLKGGNVSFENGKKGEIIGVGKGKRVIGYKYLGHNLLLTMGTYRESGSLYSGNLSYASFTYLFSS